MTDSSSPPKTYTVDFNIIDTHKLKARGTSLLNQLPAEFFPAIGHVVTIWSTVESTFDDFLIALTKTGGPAPEKWKHGQFAQRRKLFREEVSRVFASHPTILSYIIKVLEDSVDLHIKRNLLVHGKLSVKVKTWVENGESTGKTLLICNGRHKGKDISGEFSSDDIDNLYYDLGHLSGRLAMISQAGSDSGFSSEDRLHLQAFLSTNHPSFPILQTQQRQQPPSQG